MAKIIIGLNQGNVPQIVSKVVYELFGDVFNQLIQVVRLKKEKNNTTQALRNSKSLKSASIAVAQQALMLSSANGAGQQEQVMEAVPCQCEQLSVPELSVKSMFADLMILTYDSFEEEQGERKQLKEILRNSKCPVLVLPEDVKTFDQCILTYDGKESSVYALKTFSLLFSKNVNKLPASIFTVVPYDEQEIKNEKSLLELVQQHFADVGLQVLQGDDIAEEIIRFSRCSESPIIVMGAFGRKNVSNMLSPSVAGNIIDRHPVPLFIAHH